MVPEGLLPCSKDHAACRILNLKNSLHVLFDGICLRTLIMSSLMHRGRSSSFLGFPTQVHMRHMPCPYQASALLTRITGDEYKS